MSVFCFRFSRQNDKINPMIIVTAADSHYFTGLINLVGSVHYWSANCQILVFDLGMTDRQ